MQEVGVALGQGGDTEPFRFSLTIKEVFSIAPAIAKIATQDKMVEEGRPTSVAHSGPP